MNRHAKSIPIPPAIAELFRDLERDNNAREAKRAEADPRAHKLTRVMAGRYGLSYRYQPGPNDGRGRRVWFCWSVHRNVAGYFLTWREVRGKKVVRRDRWAARKSKKAARALAYKRAGMVTVREAVRAMAIAGQKELASNRAAAAEAQALDPDPERAGLPLCDRCTRGGYSQCASLGEPGDCPFDL